ncbi:MAG TPA: zinc ribbon domain-containing protein, partial [Ideonella sp.]|nr:zinc ribbon domain-containing protein [Ideonella sp.]
PATPPPRAAAVTPARPATPPSPRAVCGGRTNFALYNCMQQQCKKPQFAQHAQCRLLRDRDVVE